MKTLHAVTLVLMLCLCPGLFGPIRAEEDTVQAEIQGLVEQLGADKPAERETATARLLEIGEPARPLVEEATKSEDAERKHRAKVILDRLDLRKSSVEELLTGQTNDSYRMIETIENRGRGGGESPLDAGDKAAIIRMVLTDERADSDMRQRLLYVISSQKLKSAWPALIALAQKEPEMALTALRALRTLNVPEAKDELAKMAPGLCSSESVGEVLGELYRLKVDRNVLARAIEGALEDNTDDNRTYSLLSFAAKRQIPLSAGLVLDQVLGLDANHSAYWRQHIKNAVCSTGLADEVKKRWKDMDANNIIQFITVIKEANLTELVPLLVEAWSLPWVGGRAGNPMAASMARASYVQTNQFCVPIVDAVIHLRGEEQLVGLLSDEKAETRIAALQILQAGRFRGVFDQAETLLKDRDSRVRSEALGLAAFVDPDKAIPLAETCLEDPDTLVSTRAIRILVLLKGSSCTDRILRFLQSENPALAAAAIDELPDLDLDQVLRQLLAMYGEPATSPTALYAMAVFIARASPVRRHEIMLSIQGKVDPEALEQQLRLLQSIPK